MRRLGVQQVVVWSASLLLALATVALFADRGAPYFRRPHTVVDHVTPNGHELREVIILLPQVEPLIPRGAMVTVFRPLHGAVQDDHTSYLAAVGLLPHHFVVPPFTARHDPEHLVEWVVAVAEPFEHPHYRPVAGFPNGWLYQVRR